MNTKKIWLLLGVLAGIYVGILGGCSTNLFAPNGPGLGEGATAEEYLQKGMYYYKQSERKDKFLLDSALAMFDSAIAVDSSTSEAYLRYATVALVKWGVNLVELKDEFNISDESKTLLPWYGTHSFYDSNGVPKDNPDSAHSYKKSDSVLHGTLTALRYLQTIKSGKFPRAQDIWSDSLKRNTTIFDLNIDGVPDTVVIPKMDGVVRGGAVEFDLALLGTIAFMLTLGDQNLDGWINCRADYDVYDLWAGTNLRDSVGKINPDMNVNELKAKFNDPNKLNDYLAMAELLLVNTAQQNMNATLDSISLVQTKTATSLVTSLDGIRSMLNTVGNEITYRKYNDHKDNDYDWWDTDGDGEQDPTIWSDFHKNKKNEFDSVAHPGEYFPLTPFIIYKGPLPYGDLTMANVDSEKTIDKWPGIYTAGPQVTFRIKLAFRIETSGDTVFSWAPGSPFSSFDTIRVSTLSSGAIPIKFLDTMWTYTGPADSGEFLGGDWGVDEEIFDGKDNDGDGMVDEDTRNLKGFDDDDDWEPVPDVSWNRVFHARPDPIRWDTLGMVRFLDGHNNPARLVRADDADHFSYIKHYNDSIFSLGPLQYSKMMFLGTQRHFQYLASLDSLVQGDSSALKQYYFLNIDKGEIIAYRYRGPVTDFVAGGQDWGVDEEILDGCDNDGDGFTDEDVDVTVVAP